MVKDKQEHFKTTKEMQNKLKEITKSQNKNKTQWFEEKVNKDFKKINK